MPRIARDPIALSPCGACGATVGIKLNNHGRAYYACNGDHDDAGRSCGAAVTLGARQTATIRKAVQDGKPADLAAVRYPDPEPKPRPEPKPVAKPRTGWGGIVGILDTE